MWLQIQSKIPTLGFHYFGPRSWPYSAWGPRDRDLGSSLGVVCDASSPLTVHVHILNGSVTRRPHGNTVTPTKALLGCTTDPEAHK
jgi:hypothetical protein